MHRSFSNTSVKGHAQLANSTQNQTNSSRLAIVDTSCFLTPQQSPGIHWFPIEDMGIYNEYFFLGLSALPELSCLNLSLDIRLMSLSQFKLTSWCALQVLFDGCRVSEQVHLVFLTSGTKDQANCITALSRSSEELFTNDFLGSYRKVLSPS